MKHLAHKTHKRIRRHKKIRYSVIGTATIPRLSIFRSNKFIYAQLIDDAKAITLAQANDAKITTGTKIERATSIGTLIGEAAKKQGIVKAVFDRGGFKYTGRVQALADAARKAGLEF